MGGAEPQHRPLTRLTTIPEASRTTIPVVGPDLRLLVICPITESRPIQAKDAHQAKSDGMNRPFIWRRPRACIARGCYGNPNCGVSRQHERRCRTSGVPSACSRRAEGGVGSSVHYAGK